MKKITTATLCVFGLITVSPTIAFSGEASPNVITTGMGASINLVRIFQPTIERQPPDDSAAQNATVTVINRTIYFYSPVREHETTAQRRKRVIGHRYLGFKKQYRGYKYPF